MTFYDRLRSTTVSDKIRNINMRVQFADICLNHCEKLTSEVVYNALSHLALVPELKLDIVRYDRLRDPEECNRLNVDAYAVAKAKLVEASELSKRLLEEQYEIDRGYRLIS